MKRTVVWIKHSTASWACPYLSSLSIHGHTASPHCPLPCCLSLHSDAAAHGALRLPLLHHDHPALPRAPPQPPRAPRPQRPRVLHGLRRELLRRLDGGAHPHARRGGGRGRGRVLLRVRRRARDVGLRGGAGARGARDAALPAGAAPVRDHGRAPPRHVRGGAPRPHPALRGAACCRGRHVRGGLQPGCHPASLQHQEEEQQDRAALHLLRRHIPPLDLLHQARLRGRAAAQAQRRRRRHPLHQLQSPQEEGVLGPVGVCKIGFSRASGFGLCLYHTSENATTALGV